MAGKVIGTIDCEPTWEQVLALVTPANLEQMRSELCKMAKVSDVVRQAQKRGVAVVFYPSGRVDELSEAELDKISGGN